MKSNNSKMIHSNEAWNGVTLDELRYLRAETLIKLELQKEKISHNFSSALSIKNGNTLNEISNFTSRMSLISKILLIFKAVKFGNKLIQYFRKKIKR